ncbi:MAG: glutamine synthetase family protein [Lachnospiraceae bacterium]|nr:glutamine synthetase family protein [Lachnospiraceae bacterium]
MKYSRQEVIQFVREEDVAFVRLAFCDVFGKQKNISILPTELDRAFTQGIPIDAEAIRGFGCMHYSQLVLIPDPDTLAILPWRPEHGRVVRMFCTIHYPDGELFENDTRSILINAIEAAKNAGYHFTFGTEMEFYLFKLDENGEPTKIPYDKAGYLDIAPEDKGENVRREICLTLEQMGIHPESSHHEEGPGQNEIDFCYADALTSADNAMAFTTVVKAMATRNGVYADFSPKPLDDKPGNGMHLNISVKGKDGSVPLESMIAGILSKIEDITLFLNPSESSYRRFGSFKAPEYISWSSRNCYPLIRIPSSYGNLKRAVVNSPDSTANPYIAYALLIYAGLYGITNNLQLPPATDTANISSEDLLKHYKRLPMSLNEAREKALTSEFVAKHIPESLLQVYCNF